MLTALSQLTAPEFSGSRAAEVHQETLSMTKKSRKTNLARRLGIALITVKLIDACIDLLSKVVNYGNPCFGTANTDM